MNQQIQTQAIVLFEKKQDEKALGEVVQTIQPVALEYVQPQRIVSLLVGSVSRNPKLLKCTWNSVIDFCRCCAEVGLEPVGAGGMHPVPFFNSKINAYELKAIADYRAMLGIAVREKLIKFAYADLIREGDEYEYIAGMNPSLVHKPKPGGVNREVIAAYCIIVLSDGTRHPFVMWKDEIQKVRDASKASQKEDSPWQTWTEQMILKTVVRRALNQFVGMSRVVRRLIEIDDDAVGIEMKNELPPLERPKTIDIPAEPQPVVEPEQPPPQPAKKPQLSIDEMIEKIFEIDEELTRADDMEKNEYVKIWSEHEAKNGKTVCWKNRKDVERWRLVFKSQPEKFQQWVEETYKIAMNTKQAREEVTK
jgi:phage RecT family recombinase